MARILTLALITLSSLIFNPMENTVDRKPAVAGKFYPDDPQKLQSMIDGFYKELTSPDIYPNVLAIISPHAGYIYSGLVAASAFNQVNPLLEFDNIFVIAPSHQAAFEGASIYNLGDYITPLGKVKVNRQLSDQLIHKNDCFLYSPDFHNNEHSLEVQLPFIVQRFKYDVQIIPIIIGTQNTEILKKIASALKPYFNSQNLFIISSDFSHFPNYYNANKIDSLTAEAIMTKSDKKVMETIDQNSRNGFSSLATSACGMSGILTLLYLIGDNPEIQLKKIKYMNSGDTPHGDKSRVVGYWSMMAIENDMDDSMNFTLEDKTKLLEIARQTLLEKLSNGKDKYIDSSHLSENLKSKSGVFVSLHIQDKLRGCIGRFSSDSPLFQTTQSMAIAAAFSDPRFLPLTISELTDVKIEISVLSPLKKINSVNDIILGKHGIYIKKGTKTGTFLPQVATQTGWNVEEFLGHCSRDKAGLAWNEWKTAEVFTYTALVFSE